MYCLENIVIIKEITLKLCYKKNIYSMKIIDQSFKSREDFFSRDSQEDFFSCDSLSILQVNLSLCTSFNPSIQGGLFLGVYFLLSIQVSLYHPQVVTHIYVTHHQGLSF